MNSYNSYSLFEIESMDTICNIPEDEVSKQLWEESKLHQNTSRGQLFLFSHNFLRRKFQQPCQRLIDQIIAVLLTQ